MFGLCGEGVQVTGTATAAACTSSWIREECLRKWILVTGGAARAGDPREGQVAHTFTHHILALPALRSLVQRLRRIELELGVAVCEADGMAEISRIMIVFLVLRRYSSHCGKASHYHR